MTVFERIKEMNIDDFVEFMYGQSLFNELPSDRWFDEKYCSEFNASNDVYSWCEVNHKCKYFQHMDKVPTVKQVIKMWLESEVE